MVRTKRMNQQDRVALNRSIRKLSDRIVYTDYFCKYSIFVPNGRTFMNNQNVCFREFTSSPELFNQSSIMEVYFPINRVMLSEYTLRKYYKLIKDLGFKFTFGKCLGKNTNHIHLSSLTPYYKWTLKFSNYKSINHVKLVLHLIRLSYEMNSYKLVQQALEYINKNPDCNIVNALNIPNIFRDTFLGNLGHGFRSSKMLFELLEKEDILERLDSIGNRPDFNTSLQSFYIVLKPSYFKDNFSTCITLPKLNELGITKETPYKELKSKILKLVKDEIIKVNKNFNV